MRGPLVGALAIAVGISVWLAVAFAVTNGSPWGWMETICDGEVALACNWPIWHDGPTLGLSALATVAAVMPAALGIVLLPRFRRVRRFGLLLLLIGAVATIAGLLVLLRFPDDFLKVCRQVDDDLVLCELQEWPSQLVIVGGLIGIGLIVAGVVVATSRGGPVPSRDLGFPSQRDQRSA